MTKTNGGLLAAVFAAGMAAGGGGGYQAQQSEIDERDARIEALLDPNPTSYMAAGITEAILSECMDEPCQQLRKWQWGQIVDDIKADVKPGETFALSGLSLYVAERLDYSGDAPKELWMQDALDVINARLADGFAEGEITPEDTLTGDALVAMLEAARDA